MATNRRPLVSFVLATHNRREIVVNTLLQLRRCGLDKDDYEIIVVDNASQDGTPEAAAALSNKLVQLSNNEGSCAKAHGVQHASGLFLMFLDDDAHPRPGSMARMVERFEQQDDLGAAGFTVHLPHGALESSALPGVFHGCGVGLRAETLRRIGNLDVTFFMQAEEYDLCFRLVNAGWKSEVFGDLQVDHLKTHQARRDERTTYYDSRNNLRLAARYLPADAYRAYTQDWVDRYRWLAIRSGHQDAFERGRRAGRRLGAIERWKYRRHRLKPAAFENFFRWESIQSRMTALAELAIHRIVLADLGKNVFAFYRAALSCGLDVQAIADDVFSAPLREYRGIPVLSLDSALSLEPDCVVISNTAGAFADLAGRRVAARTARPVLNWFAPSATEPVMSLG